MASPTTSTVRDIKNSAEFNKALSKASSGLAVALFWAEWHEPCHLVVKIVQQLAKDNENIRFFQLEAENVPDISDKYEITSVPTLVLFKKNVVFQKLENASTQVMVSAVEKLGKSVSVSSPEYAEERDLNLRLGQLVNASPVMLFMKGQPDCPRCGFSKKIVHLLRDRKITFGYFDILTDPQVRKGLKEFSNWPTYPQLYIDGKLIGGLDIVNEMIEGEEFDELIPKTAKAEEIKERINGLINQNPVMLFMKGTPDTPRCGFSRSMVALLKENGFKDFGHFDILTDTTVRQQLKEISNWPTYPQLYVKGSLLGGLDVVREMAETGELCVYTTA